MDAVQNPGGTAAVEDTGANGVDLWLLKAFGAVTTLSEAGAFRQMLSKIRCQKSYFGQ